VLFMSGQRLEETTRGLIANGKAASTPSAIVESASWENQRVIEAPLCEIAARAREANVGSPALLVIGEVVRLRAQLLATVDDALAAGAGS
jgi:uroporphyrin-III C-methyltransferase